MKRRFSGIVALSVCLIGSGWSDTVLAADVSTAQPAAAASNSTLQTQPLNLTSRLVIGEQAQRAMAAPLAAQPLAQRGWYRGGRRGRRNGVASAEMVLGAVGMIAGAAVLTYANRPDCSVSALNDGCSYGTKVAGASLAAAGAVSFLAGALTWR